MYHLDDDYFERTNQPSSSTVNFPSESVRFGGSNSQQPPLNSNFSVGADGFLSSTRFRSHSADNRRSAFQQQARTISEDHNESSRTSEISFPSQQRRSASTTPWTHFENQSISQSHLVVPSDQSFSDHLRERSPASGSALLDLLSRYPSAQNSVHNTQSLINQSQNQPEKRQFNNYVQQPANNFSLSYPLIEYSVRSDEPSGTRTTSVYQNIVPLNNGTNKNYQQRVQTTFTSSGPVSSSINQNLNNSTSIGSSFGESNIASSPSYYLHHHQPVYQQQAQFGSYPFKNRLEQEQQQQFYNNSSASSATANFQHNHQSIGAQLDDSSSLASLREPDQLELLAARLLDDNMSRSTAEWSKSFEQLQNRFKTLDHDDFPTTTTTFSTSGSMTLPRRGLQQGVSKSSSNYDMNYSLLGKAVERRAAEAPEPRRSGALDSFWSQTISSRPSSPTIQRIPTSLTAAERLQMLQEPIDTEKRSQHRVGTGQTIAAKKAELMRENLVERSDKPRSPLNPSFPSNSFLTPNFNDLDNAVHELNQATARVNTSNAYINNSNQSQKLFNGCARFPTGEHAFSPPPPLIQTNVKSTPIHPKLHSPSPTYETSESSSIYQIPTGLPYPKPKHNVKEQLYLAGIQTPSYQMARSIYRNGPNFPVPTTGSVASRITEFEKRPGTPIMQISPQLQTSQESLIPSDQQRFSTPSLTISNSSFTSPTNTTTPTPPTTTTLPQTNGNMSPRSAMFRAKPIIHVDLGVTSTTSSNNLNSATNQNGKYQTSSPQPIRHIQVQSVKVQQPQPQPTKQFDSSTHSIFNFKSNSVSAASATQVQTDVSPTKSPQLAELNVASPVKRTSSAPSPRLNLNGSLDSNGNYGRKSVSQNDVSFAAELTLPSSQKSATSSLDIGFDNYIDEQYKPTPKTLPPPIKSIQPKLIAPKEPIYFPQGKPVPAIQNDAALRRVCEVFKTLPNQKCEYENISAVCLAAGIPLYWKMPVYSAITNNENRPATQVDFTSWWKAMTSVAHDEASRFVYTLSMGSRSYLVPDDFYDLVLDIIYTHPGMWFFRDTIEFHDRYCQVVITRIFWNDAHTWSGRMTTERLRRGKILTAIRDLASVDDINKSLRYFSYEHFYVVYCKFWEIDSEHVLRIKKDDLAKHAGGALVPLVIDRIFSGAVCTSTTKGQPIEDIGLTEFTQFLLAEEDKTHPVSVEYWFRILDLDGDGIVTLYDMELFYSQIKKKLAAEGLESLEFTDLTCQLIDMLDVDGATSFKLSDLKKSQLRGRFINTFVNWRKFFVQEANEGSESPRMEDEVGQELTEWDRYCIEEYEALMYDNQADAETISLNLEEDDSKTGLSYHDLL